MTREEKKAIIDNLAEKISNTKNFYLTDISGLNAESTSKLRRLCFEKEINLLMVKNTLFQKALEAQDGKYDELIGVLKENTAVMFSESSSQPAKLIKEFSRSKGKPVLKAAYVEESIYIGAENLEALVNIKSKEELVGEIIGLLQSPAKNVLSSLQSAGGKLAGILKTLSEKE